MTNQPADLKFVVTNTLIVTDIKRSVAFYRDVLGATVPREGEPTFLRLANIWITINSDGGGTDDRPEVTAAPPRDPNLLSNFLNLRVADIRRAMKSRRRGEPNLSPSRKYTRRKSAVTCGILTDTASRWGKRP